MLKSSTNISSNTILTELGIYVQEREGFRTEPHGALLTTFANDTALQSIKKKRDMAYGSIIVKDNYMMDNYFLYSRAKLSNKKFD